MKLARDICVANPGAHVLIVAVELCSLHFQQKTDMDFIIANSLFADGAAAIMVGPASEAAPTEAGGPLLLLDGFASRIIPGSEKGNALHHFTEDQARTLLLAMSKKASRKFFASDLSRSPVAWIAFLAFSTIFLHGSFTR